MPVTFGAVGDIISVSLLLKDILVALDDSRGSCAEYQQLISELYILDRALLEIDQLCRRHEGTAELMALRSVAQKAVNDCRNSMDAFLTKFAKYRKALGAGSRANFMCTFPKKIQFAVIEKGTLEKFRAEIVAHSLSLNMLLTTASAKVMTINDEKLSARLELGNKSINDVLARQDSVLGDIRDQLAEGNRLVATTNSTTNNIAKALRFQWLRDIGTGLKSLIQKNFVLNIQTYQAVRALHAKLPHALERSMVLSEEPIIFEDARGHIVPIHTNLIDTWKLFDIILETKFEGAPGLQKVVRKDYVLQDRATNREIDRAISFRKAFIPGQKIDMSIIFRSAAGATPTSSHVSTPCPRCHCLCSTAGADKDTVCSNTACKMIFRRIIDDAPPPLASIELSPCPSIGKKRALPDDDSFKDFKRVRLISHSLQQEDNPLTDDKHRDLSKLRMSEQKPSLQQWATMLVRARIAEFGIPPGQNAQQYQRKLLVRYYRQMWQRQHKPLDAMANQCNEVTSQSGHACPDPLDPFGFEDLLQNECSPS